MKRRIRKDPNPNSAATPRKREKATNSSARIREAENKQEKEAVRSKLQEAFCPDL